MHRVELLPKDSETGQHDSISGKRDRPTVGKEQYCAWNGRAIGGFMTSFSAVSTDKDISSAIVQSRMIKFAFSRTADLYAKRSEWPESALREGCHFRPTGDIR